MFIKFNAKNYINISLKFSSRENFIQSIKNIIKAIQLEPQNAEFYNIKGDIYYELKEYKKVIKEYKKAI